MNIDQSINLLDLILALGYAEIRSIFEEEIEEEIKEAYKKGISDTVQDLG